MGNKATGDAAADAIGTLGRNVPGDPVGRLSAFKDGWETTTLGEVADIKSGSTPGTGNPAYWNGSIPWCTPTDITNTSGKYLLTTDRSITEEGLNSCGASLLPAGALLLCSRATIGDVRIAHSPICTNQGFKPLVAKDGICNEFLYYLVLTLKPNMVDLAAGSTFLEIGKHDLASIRVQLPPRDEQRAIAEALSDVDGLLGALEMLIAKKRAIQQAAMQQLLTGRIRLPGFSGEWETKRLGEIADVDPENLPGNTNPEYGFNYISLEQVDAGRLLDYTEEVFGTAPSRARRILRPDNILMSTVRPNLMAHLLFRGQISNAVCSTGFAVLRCKPHLSAPGFIFAHLFGHVVNSQIDKVLGGSNYPAINSRDVKQIEIPCPSEVREQVAIGAVLSDMDAEIAALERRRDKVRAVKRGMMEQLLTGRVRLA